MKLKKIKEEYFKKHPVITQKLDDYQKKKRGYGIVLVSVKNLLFGIPLHSNIDKKYGFPLAEKNGKISGLNYQKAILVNENDLDRSFRIPSNEFDKIQDNAELIKKEFENYLAQYLLLIEQKKFQQASREYKKSTIVNYYRELGIIYKQNKNLLNSLSTLS